jgi:hypothetical protein
MNFSQAGLSSRAPEDNISKKQLLRVKTVECFTYSNSLLVVAPRAIGRYNPHVSPSIRHHGLYWNRVSLDRSRIGRDDGGLSVERTRVRLKPDRLLHVVS